MSKFLVRCWIQNSLTSKTFRFKKVQNFNPILEIDSEEPSHFLAHGNFSLFPPLKTKNGDPTWSFIYKTSGTCKDDISSKNLRRGPGSTKCCVKDYFRNIKNNLNRISKIYIWDFKYERARREGHKNRSPRSLTLTLDLKKNPEGPKIDGKSLNYFSAF